MSDSTARANERVDADHRLRIVRLLIASSLTLLLLLLPRFAAGQEWKTVTSSRRASGEDMLRVVVEYGAGKLDVGPGAAGTLYRSNMRYDAAVFRPKLDYADKRLVVGMEGGSVRGRNIKGGELDLRLAPDLPLMLDLKFGAAEASLELGGLRVRRAEVSTGASVTRLRVSQPNEERCESLELQVGAARFEAIGLGNLNAERLRVQGGVGEVVLDFTGAWSGNMNATIEMGLGSLVLNVPRGLGVRVQKGGMLASFDSQHLVKRGDSFYSENWESAKYKLDVQMQAAFGAIKIVWLD